jgi:ABC-2 type transport system permease protein
MPKFVQVIAELNPLYHMNNLFIAIWNGQLTFNNSTLISIGYIAGLVMIALIITRFSNQRRIS